MVWEDMRKNALKDVASWRKKDRAIAHKFQLLAWTTIISRRKTWKRSENYPISVLELSCFACIWHEFCRPTILWSVNKLAGADTKWTRACDERSPRLIAYIHQRNDHRQYCHVGHTAQHCRSGLFQDSDFAGDLEDSKSTSVRILRTFGSRTFVPTSWMCNKPTSVSHSSTESEVIS